MITVDPQAVARYEEIAANHPRWYRLRVAVVALLGDFALMFLQLLPVAIFLGVPLLFLRHPLYYWAGGAAFLFFIWILRPASQLSGRELSRGEAPDFFLELDRLRQHLNVPGRMRVFIDDKLNASAGESRGLFGIFGTTRVLTLGMPLLWLLPREQVLAVIAHEFGHFSRRHGRLGHWLYRARAGWLSHVESASETDSAYWRALSSYGKFFVPHFSALSFVHSRQCEYEADADAASVMGAKAIGAALSRIAVQAEFWAEEINAQIAQRCREQAAAPDDFYRQSAELARSWESAQRDALLAKALAEPDGYTDTHPGLARRLAALGTSAGMEGDAEAGGAALFGVAWEKLCAEFDADWCKKNRMDWRIRHLHYQFIGLPLMQLDDAALVRLAPEQRIMRANTMCELSPAEGWEEVQKIYRQMPDDDDVAYLFATNKFAGHHDSAVETLQQIWQRSPVHRLLIGARLRDHFAALGETRLATTWDAKLTASRKTRQAAHERFRQSAASAEAVLLPLSGEVQKYLMAAMAQDEFVAAAWLSHGRQTLIETRGPAGNRLDIYSLHLRLDTAALARAGCDEDDAAARYASALRRALLPRDEILVSTSLTTEPLRAAFKEMDALYRRG